MYPFWQFMVSALAIGILPAVLLSLWKTPLGFLWALILYIHTFTQYALFYFSREIVSTNWPFLMSWPYLPTGIILSLLTVLILKIVSRKALPRFLIIGLAVLLLVPDIFLVNAFIKKKSIL